MASPARENKVRLLDSTLREGEQHPGVSFTEKQRAQIAWELDSFGVDQIEISPAVSGSHKQSLKTILSLGLQADVVAQGRSMRPDIDVALECDAKWCAAYLGISDIHLHDKLRIARADAVDRAVDAVEYAKAHGLKIRFTLEDGSRADPAFVREMCRAVSGAGVDRIGLPDTVGALLPSGMAAFVKLAKDASPNIPLDVHTHNDMGLALANSLAGIDAGADQIHVTVNGVGERTGIPSLAEAAVVLTKFYGSKGLRLNQLCDISRHVAMYTGLRTAEDKPLVGASAYKHKAGTHLAAVTRNPKAYEFVSPETVGNRRRVVFGDLAGRAGAAHLMSVLGMDPDDDRAMQISAALKAMGRGDLLEMPLESDQPS